MEMNWKDEIQNIERKRVQGETAENERDNLTFVKVGNKTYRVFNKKTKRFHDLELGIDLVT